MGECWVESTYILGLITNVEQVCNQVTGQVRWVEVGSKSSIVGFCVYRYV